MEKLVITGGRSLHGTIRVQGAKNSCLPVLGAAMLAEGESVLHRCPALKDVSTACHILEELGCRTHWEEDALCVCSRHMDGIEISETLMRQMRSSIVFLGAMLARNGEAVVHFPGGCDIGSRPIDLHISALRKMNVVIREHGGSLECKVPGGRMKGAEIFFAFPSVGATENLLLAASTAQGHTVLNNAAAEPEVADLARFLNACGARIRGIGTSTLFIEGVQKLTACEYQIIPDRIAAATLLAAAAITDGELMLHDVCPTDLSSILPLLEEAGCTVREQETSIYLKGCRQLRHVESVKTMPYPGFPTDAQPIMMALACKAKGTSVFVETIFENRFRHVPQLKKFGANIQVQDRVAIVEGASELTGACAEATDLRGGAAVTLAALAAQGVSEITNVGYIDRGYEALERQLSGLGAQVCRRSINE